MTSTALGTFASSVQYNPDGSIGYDQDKITDTRTWSQAGLSFATSFATQSLVLGMKSPAVGLQSNLLSTSMTTALNTMSQNIKVQGDGGWDWQGFGNIDAQKALVEGTASYVSSTATGKFKNEYVQAFTSQLISSYVKAGMGELFEEFGGRDFNNAYSLNKPITVDTLSISTRQSLNSALDYFLSSDKKGKTTTKVKVPKEVMKKIRVLEKNDTGNKSVYDSILSSAELPRYKTVEVKTTTYEVQDITVDSTPDTRTTGTKLIDGFTDAFSDFGTIGEAFTQEIQFIGNDLSKIGGGIAAGMNYAYEGVKSLGNMAINGVKNLFTSKAPEQTLQPVAKQATWNEAQERGRQNWSKQLKTDLKKDGVKLDVRLIKQANSKDCVFSSYLMSIENKLGDTINPEQLRILAVEKGIVTDEGYVKDANALAKLAGLKDVSLQKFRGSGDDLLKSMIQQLEKGNPVMVLLPGPDGSLGHMEAVVGYKFDKSGELKILLNDPGYQKDTYLDPKTMQPYRIREGEKIYSHKGIFTKERRTAYGFNHYQNNKK